MVSVQNSAHCASQSPSIGRVHPQRASAPVLGTCIFRKVGFIRAEHSIFNEERRAYASDNIPSAVCSSYRGREEREVGVETGDVLMDPLSCPIKREGPKPLSTPPV